MGEHSPDHLSGTPDFGFHIVRILDGVRHYHERGMGVDYIFEGEGKIERDGDAVDLKRGPRS